MDGTRKAVQVAPAPPEPKKISTVRLRVQVTTADVAGVTQVADVLLQAGGTASGWVPHVTEMPWTAGVVGG